MSKFNLPNGWEVSHAESWVSTSSLQDNGFPSLGDPSFCEKPDCDCDTKSFADGMGIRMPNPERENRIITAINPETKKRERVTQCPPGFEQQDENAPVTTCIPSQIEGKAGLKARAQLAGGSGGLKNLPDLSKKLSQHLANKSNLKKMPEVGKV